MAKSLKIICVLDYYLPGFKGGGPITTIANMRTMLNDQIDLAIFTRNHDLKSTAAYSSVQSDSWNLSSDGLIYYASEPNYNYKGLQQAIYSSKVDFDLLYLNSFFGFKSSIQINLKFHRDYPSIPILIAPRGEFSRGALAIKSYKKRIFLAIAKLLRLYEDVAWHASTHHEMDDIVRQFPKSAKNIYIAEDPIDIHKTFNKPQSYQPSPRGHLRLAFISRISRKKNLDGLLGLLAKTNRQVNLSIFGPIEDIDYWQKCRRLMSLLPSNVSASYHNALEPDAVSETFSNYDLFAFPTYGENFGHVIFEALRAGTPALVSDQTPWKADATGAVSVVALADSEAWITNLEAAADRSEDEKAQLRIAARTYAENFVQSAGIAEKNLAMFQAVVRQETICES